MQSILHQLDDQAVWEEFLAHRLVKGRFTWSLFSEADDYVANERYRPVAQAFIRGEGPGIPERKRINKMGTAKKRTIYCFSPDETRVLKLLAYLLYRYDDRFSHNCYAFRRGIKASDAIFRLRKALQGRKTWAYKLDIHDYFNSISIPILLPVLRGLLSDDPPLYAFFERMLTDGRARVNGEIVRESRGVMAGTPTSPFLADVYLMEVDAIDVSRAVRDKMKGKIRRAARALLRWRMAKGLDAEQAMKGMIRKFDAKFFEDGDPDALSWSRWFFPVINRTEGLKEIDAYLQKYLRYLSTGRHAKANYRVRYADLKALGYRSLVHEYYRYRSSTPR